MKQVGVQAHLKKKKQAQAVVKQHAQALSKDEQLRYNNFWAGVEASMLLQNHQLRHTVDKIEGNKNNGSRVRIFINFNDD